MSCSTVPPQELNDNCNTRREETDTHSTRDSSRDVIPDKLTDMQTNKLNEQTDRSVSDSPECVPLSYIDDLLKDLITI